MVNIAYHNPSVTRPHRWAGERGRQLIEAMRRGGGEVRAVPSPGARTAHPGTDTGSAVRERVRAHLPRGWRRPIIRLRLLQRGTINTIRWSWRLWRELRVAPPDVLLARYHEFEWTPLIVARLIHRPLVLEVHSPFALEGTLRGDRPSRVAGWIDRVFFRRADLIWVHTPALRDLVAEQALDPGKIRLIPFGVEDPAVVATPGTSDGPVEISFVGSFYPWHGIEELLSAFARARQQVTDLHLTIIGDGITRPDCIERARKLGIEQAVSFPGWLDRNALYAHLQQSHLGVAPYLRTRYNYFEPVKILDYQIAGLPSVASAVGHIPAMVEDGQGGLLVPPGNIEDLAAAMVKLAIDPDLRHNMGLAARRVAHRVDDTAGAVVEICRQAAAMH